MVGRVNVGGSNKIKNISGTFTASNSSSQTSFTVTGVEFTPKVIVVMMTTANIDDLDTTGSSSCLSFQMIDLINNVKFIQSFRSDLHDFSYIYSTSDGGASYNDNILTVTSGSTGYSEIPSSGLRPSVWGTYKYYIYGI